MDQHSKNSSSRYLIAIGSPHCDGMGLAELGRVAGDVDRVVELFSSPEQGYERVLADEIPLGATAQQIKDGLADWFAAPERASSDCVLLYYAGHGDEIGKAGHHYLFTSDSTERELFKKALKTKDLVEIFFEGEGERPQNILLILDTCYSGQGSNQALAAVAQAKQVAVRGDSGLWVLASADPLTEAADGLFVDAMLSVMNDDAWLPRGGKQFLNPLDLKDGINEWFGQRQHPQRAVAGVIGVESAPTFIRNPRYTRQLDGHELSDQAHWDPKARGVEGLASPGWFFTGRENALRHLVRWLSAETSDLRARVVTGGPGSGKSAVLGRLVTCAQPETRRRMQREGALGNDPDLLPEIGSIDAVLYAHGANLSGMVTRLAEQLRLEGRTLETVLAELAGRRMPTRIVVDALDEADHPLELESELLSKLAVCPAVRLIVGSRKRNGIAPLAGINEIIDLDAPGYFSESDLADYVMARLIRRAPPTVYAEPSRHADAERIGQTVAHKAGRSFLYARIVSRWLAAATAPLDTAQPGWERQLKLPEDLTEAFGQDLGRFPDERRKRFFDLLVPLAYARGKGLPQKNIWHTLATRVAGRDYNNGDLRELKQQAGYYLVQDTEHDETVYRLFHQTFADYLKEQTRDEDVERTITGTLIELATPAGAAKPAWEQLREPYLLGHLPAHAAGANKLDELVADPEFLLAMPPESLLPELFKLSTASRKVAAAYRKASSQMRTKERGHKCPYLLLWALQQGAINLAEKLRRLNVTGRWYPEWGWWPPTLPSEVAVNTDEKIGEFIIAEDDNGEPVVVTGSNSISVWDMRTGQKLAQSDSFPGNIHCLVFTHAKERRIIASGWDTGAIRVFALNSGALLREIKQAHNQSELADKPSNIGDLCIVCLDGQPVLASGGYDLALRLWSLPELLLLGEKLQAHNDWIYHLAAAKLGETEVLISASDSASDHANSPSAMACVWRVKDLSLLSEIPRDRSSFAYELKPFVFEGRAALLINTSRSELEFWDLERGTRLATASIDLRSISVSDWQSEPVIMGNVWSQFRKLKIEPAQNDPNDLPYRLRLIGEPVNIGGNKLSSPFHFSGRSVLAGLSNNRIRLWDIAELLEGAPVFEDDPLENVIADSATGMIVTGSTRGFLRARDARDGTIKWEAKTADSSITGLAAITIADRAFLAVGNSNGDLFVYDLSVGGRLHGPIQTGSRINSLAAFEWNGAPYCAAAVRMEQPTSKAHVVRVWNLDNGQEHDTHIDEQDSRWVRHSDEYIDWALTLSSNYMREKPLNCVAVDHLMGEPLVVAGGPHGEIYKWCLRNLEVAHTRYQAMTRYVQSLATGELRGQTVILFGLEDGTLNLMDLAGGEILQSVSNAHKGWVTAVAAMEIEGSPRVLSGGADGIVKIWSPDLEELYRIEIEDQIVSIAPMMEGRVVVAASRGLMMLTLCQ
jgi:WD40 repeat protein